MPGPWDRGDGLGIEMWMRMGNGQRLGLSVAAPCGRSFTWSRDPGAREPGISVL